MSYCRWSDDDYQCDLYCYESDAGFITHVAGNRIVFKEPLPPTVELTADTVAEFAKRHQEIMDMCDRSEHKNIGLPFDGMTFCDETPEELLKTLLMLKETGYRFPEYVIEAVKEEMRR